MTGSSSYFKFKCGWGIILLTFNMFFILETMWILVLEFVKNELFVRRVVNVKLKNVKTFYFKTVSVD